MIKRGMLMLAVAFVAIATDSIGQDPLAGSRPNIVLILADDMGFSDIGSYGGEIDTPNLDALAENGLRYTQFYNAARCCPTRASLLTGLYPHQAGMGWMTAADMRREAYRGELNRTSVTIAEALRPAGYGTYMSGKWHLTREDHFEEPQESWPLQRGFDRFYGTLRGSTDFYRPEQLIVDNTLIEPAGDFYFTDTITSHASQYIVDHDSERPDDPFFLYVAYTAPHWPMQAPEETVAKYRARYAEGWDDLREARYRAQESAGMAGKAWPLSARDGRVRDWDSLGAERRDDLIERMAIYAAMVDRMDAGIGEIVATLERTERFQDTLIVFLSDNGGNWEGGIWGWNQTPDVPVNTAGSNVSYGQSWANLSNTPFKEYKSRTHEGGIATPLIVHWPAAGFDSGAWRDHVSHAMDILPTALALAGVPYPEENLGESTTPLEGRSLLASFRDDPPMPRTLIWEHEANRAVRVGDWKLVARGLRRDWELYDLGSDRTETNDLAKSMPEKVDELAAIWNRHAERTDVLPLDGTNWFMRIDKYAPGAPWPGR